MTYRLLDSGNFNKLEQVGPFRLVRPSPSATWEPECPAADWQKADAVFERFSDGDGDWKIQNAKVNDPWLIELAGLRFKMKLTSFGHLGIFPEQRANWLQLEEIIGQRRKTKPAVPVKVLNLFAYTGGSSLISAKAGAEVTHVDASKGSVTWARENAAASGLEARPIRWLVDDVQDFVDRELRRNNKYHGIILDPPTYGRGPNKQVWKIEENLTPFLQKLFRLLDDDPLFMLLSCHSPGYTPTALENQLRQILKGISGLYSSTEMIVENPSGLPLPSGCSCLFSAES